LVSVAWRHAGDARAEEGELCPANSGIEIIAREASRITAVGSKDV